MVLIRDFIQHWKKGWKFLLLLVCLAAAYFLIVLPITIIVQVILNLSMFSYYVIVSIAGLILAPAVTQYIFELFYGRQRCRRDKQ